jgi:hypothetical protein
MPNDDAVPEVFQRRSLRTIPGWLFSLAIHLGTLLTLQLLFPVVPPHGTAVDSRTVGIAIVARNAERVEYLTDASEDAGGANAAASAGQTANLSPSAESPTLPSADETPRVGNFALPAPTAEGNAANSIALLPSASGFAQGTGRGDKTGSGDGLGKGVETGVFGVRGKGSRFVYVFDRSASMAGFQGRPLASAKRELLESIRDLQSTHQFQIIFYNDVPIPLNPRRTGRPELFLAGDAEKRWAEEFVSAVVPDGATRHAEALKLALQWQPDVIFFLTDGDEPQLRAAELAEIRRLNRATTIHAIEFGAGVQPRGESFLQRLAEQNGGKHGYVDVTKLPLP